MGIWTPDAAIGEMDDTNWVEIMPANPDGPRTLSHLQVFNADSAAIALTVEAVQNENKADEISFPISPPALALAANEQYRERGLSFPAGVSVRATLAAAKTTTAPKWSASWGDYAG